MFVATKKENELGPLAHFGRILVGFLKPFASRHVRYSRSNSKWNNLDQDVKDHAVSKRPVAIKLEYLSQSKCSDQFDLTKNGSEVLLKMRRTNQVYQPHEFCVTFQSDGTLGALVATRLEDQWVEQFEHFLESKFEEQALNMTQHAIQNTSLSLN